MTHTQKNKNDILTERVEWVDITKGLVKIFD